MAGFGKEYQMMFALNGQVQSGFTASFSKASATVAKMQSQLVELNNQQNQISAYEKQQQAIEKTQNKLQLLQKQYDNIQAELDETGGKSSDLKNKLLAKQAAIEKTSDTLNKQTAKLDEMGAAMIEAGIDTNNLTGEQKRLEAELMEVADRQQEMIQKSDGMTQALDAAGSALTALGLSKLLQEYTQTMTGFIEVSGDFEASMSQVAATMGTTSGSVQNLSEYAKEMGATTAFTAKQSAEGLNILAMSGLNAEEQMQGLPVVLDLAAAGNMELAQSAGYVTTSVKGFQDSMENAQYYADLMAKGATMANTNVQQLGEALANSGATAHTYSQEAESVTLALLRLAEQGEVGSAAGTMLTRAMTDLYAPTANAKKALDDLNISAYDSNHRAKEFNEVVDELSQALAGYSEEQRNAYINQIFTTNGMQAFNKMTTSSTEKVNKFAEGLRNASGSAARQAKTQLDNMNGAYTIMQSALEGVSISMGELYQNDMKELYKAGAEILTQMNEFINENPGLVKGLTAGAGATLAFGTAVAGVSAGMKLLNPLMDIFATSVGGLSLGGLTLAVGALTAGGIMLYDALTADSRAIAEMSKAALSLEDSINSANTAFEDSIIIVEATSQAADGYIEDLKEMQKAGLDTEEAQRQYHNTLALLVQTIPELAEQIDLENDVIKGGIIALEERAKAWKEDEKAQAYQQKMTEIYAAQADVTIEANKNSIKLTNAYKDLKKAEEANTKATEEYQAKQLEFNEKLLECSETGEGYAEVLSEMNEYERTQKQVIIETAKALEEASDAYDIAKAATDNDTAALEAAQKEYELAKEDCENLTHANQEGAEAFEEQARAMDDFNSIIANTQSEIDILTESYNKAYEAATQSITGQYNLWDEAAEITTTSINQINSNMESQQKYWESYNENLDTLAENVNRFDGLGDVLASFVDGSEESAAAVAGIAEAINKGNDADVQTLITNYKSLQEEQSKTAESVADLQTEYTERVAELVAAAGESVQDLNLSDEARAAATETINSYINTISGSSGRVSAAYRSIYNAALSSLKSAGGSGAKDTDGYASGTENAQQGYKLVGEEGPELMYFHGGEKVYDAAETRDILSRSGVEAREYNNVTTQNFNPSVNISFNITGTKDTAADLQRYADDFAEKVLDVLSNNSADLARRAFA